MFKISKISFEKNPYLLPVVLVEEVDHDLDFVLSDSRFLRSLELLENRRVWNLLLGSAPSRFDDLHEPLPAGRLDRVLQRDGVVEPDLLARALGPVEAE